jgi:hypothetical protein
VIVDHSDMRAYIRSCLAGQFTVCEAADGQEGLAVAQSAVAQTHHQRRHDARRGRRGVLPAHQEDIA